MICLLIQTKFDININNDELLKTIWEHFFKKDFLFLIISGSVKQCGAQVPIM